MTQAFFHHLDRTTWHGPSLSVANDGPYGPYCGCWQQQGLRHLPKMCWLVVILLVFENGQYPSYP